MRLLTFSKKGLNDLSIGVLIDGKVLDLHKASNGKLPGNMLAFIEGGDDCLKIANDLIKSSKSESLISLSDIDIKAPLLNPPSLKDFFAFEGHAKAGAKRRGVELNEYWYEIPVYYKGNHRQIFGLNDEIQWPSYTRRLDFECEIACVLGKKGKNLSTKEASDHIFGYMIFNDFSARDIQKKEMALLMGPAKSKDFANAFGPYLITKDEVDPSSDLNMSVKINNEVWSTGNFKDQYWGFPLMISHVSQEEFVYPGDIFGSGTFFGGCGLDLDRWLSGGDTIELEVGKLGVLKNKISKQSDYKELNYKNSAEVKCHK